MADCALLLDTNCWLDYYIPNRPNGSQTRELIRYSFVYDIKLLYPAAIAKDVFYLIELDTKRFIRSAQGKLTQSAAALASGAYLPQTSSAISRTRATLAHCSSSVSLLPTSQLAKPHCGDR